MTVMKSLSWLLTFLWLMRVPHDVNPLIQAHLSIAARIV